MRSVAAGLWGRERRGRDVKKVCVHLDLPFVPSHATVYPIAYCWVRWSFCHLETPESEIHATNFYCPASFPLPRWTFSQYDVSQREELSLEE